MDLPLTEKGIEQAMATGQALRTFPKFDVVYTSPYTRTKQTTSLLLKELGYAVPLILEERLREKEFGTIDRLTKKGVETLYPLEAERKRLLGKYFYRPPGGENYPDANLRVHSFLDTLIREHSKQNVLIVCHGVIVYSFRKLLERLEEPVVVNIDIEDEIRNCGVTTYSFDTTTGKLALKEYNRTFWV